MRTYEVRLIPEEGWFHPFDRLVANEPGVERVAVHQMKLIDDTVGVMLYEFSGEYSRAERLMEELLGSLEYQISEVDGRIFVHSMFEPNDTLRELLRIPRDQELILDTPMTFTRDGGLQVTYIGTEESFREAVESVPDNVRIRLERKREFRPEVEPFVSRLTSKQQTIFEKARDMGYYEHPRNASQSDLADELDVSSATIGEHLRKIEKELVTFATAMSGETSTDTEK